MFISNNFNTVLSNKIQKISQNNTLKTQSYYRKNENQTDTFELTANNQVSFKGGNKISVEILNKATKSKSFWAVLGGAVLATATALWKELTKDGEREVDLTVEEIEKLIRENMPIQDSNQVESNTQVENVIDVEAKEVKTEEVVSEQTTVVEAPKRRRGRPPKKIKLEGGKQLDEGKIVLSKKEEISDNAEKIRALTEKGLNVIEIVGQTGLSDSIIKKIARKAGIKLIAPPKKMKAEYELDVQKIRQYAGQGLSQADIAKKIGISELQVSRIVARENIQTAKKQKKEKIEEFSNEDILRIFEINKFNSKAEVAAILGLKSKQLDDLCVKRGIGKFVQQSKAEAIDEVKLMEEILAGKTTIDLSEKYGVSLGDLRKIYKKMGIKNNNRAEKTQLTAEIIRTILMLKEQKASINEIIEATGVSTPTIVRITMANTEKEVKQIQELAEKGLSLEEIARTLSKKPLSVKAYADYAGIVLKSDKAKEFYVVHEMTNEQGEIVSVRTKVNPETMALLDELKQNFEEELAIVKNLRVAEKKVAKKEVYGRKHDFSSQKVDSGVIRYSTKDLFDRYIAKSFNMMYKLGDGKGSVVRNFIDKTKEPRLLLNIEQNNFIQDVYRHIDEPVPQKDPLFIEYRSCFDKRQFMARLEILKQRYIHDVANEVFESEISTKIQELNPEITMTPALLLKMLVNEGEVAKVVATKSVKIVEEGITETSEVLVEKQPEKTTVDYLKDSLENYINIVESNDELYMRLIDFTNNAEECDEINLKKFILLLEKVSQKEVTLAEVNQICSKEKIYPLKNEITSILAAENKTLETTIEVGEETLAEFSEDENKEYKELLSGVTKTDDSLKNLVIERYRNYLGNEENGISEEEAIEFLKKVEAYSYISAEDAKDSKAPVNSLSTITEIFNPKGSTFEKRILDQIIKQDYLTKDTIIWNQDLNRQITLTQKLKKKIFSDETMCIEILNAIEKAAGKVSGSSSEFGIDDWVENKKYSKELRLVGKFGRIRLYSKRISKTEENYVFSVFVPDHDRNKRKK